jgi:hypothetical protein
MMFLIGGSSKVRDGCSKAQDGRKVTAGVVIGVTAISGVFDAGASEAAVPGEIALEEAILEGGTELAANILPNNEVGVIIGWGTSQSAEQVAITKQLTASITESDVAGMEAKGLNRATVERFIDVYEKAMRAGGLAADRLDQGWS